MRHALALVLLTLGLVEPLSAQGRPDRDLFEAVASEVNRYAFFTIFDSVHVQVHDGRVVLTGKVTTPHKAHDIAARVSRIAGVHAVVNGIDALPVSNFDTRLRLRIASALYRHPALQMYGVGRFPSIHVIVERGHVTLDGVVHNDADRLIAGALAQQSDAFDVNNALQTSEEVTRALQRL